jgi:membrane protease YdiL (CAAX protease family)
MSVPNSADRPPAPHSALRGLVASHPVVAFLVLTFALGWISLIPILLSENGFGVLPIELPLTVVQTVATIVALAFPAFLVTAATGGREGVRDLLRRLLRWRVGLQWYLFVLFGLPMGVLLSAIVVYGVAPLGALARNWALLFTAFLPGVIVPFLHTNLWEELGWTGFLQSTLQDRRGPLLASLIVVPFFALFHLPARFVAGWIVDDHTPLAQVPTVALGYFVLTAVVAVFFRVLIMWIYNGSGRSVIIVGLFHSAFNMTIGNKVMPELLNLPASQTSLMCLGVLAVLAVAVVVFTRGHLAYERPAGTVGTAARPRVC